MLLLSSSMIYKREKACLFAVEYLDTYRGCRNNHPRSPSSVIKNKKKISNTRANIIHTRRDEMYQWPKHKEEGSGRKYSSGDSGGGGRGHVRVTRKSCVEARDRFLAIP